MSLHSASPAEAIPGPETGVTSAAAGRRPASAQAEALGGAAVAVVDLQPGAVGGGTVRSIQAAAGLRVPQRTVGLLVPHLATDPVAVPQLDQSAVGGAVADDVEAAA